MSYEVVSEELSAHAAKLDDLAGRVATAVSAAEVVSMSDQAYGLLCSFLPPIVNPLEDAGVTALRAAGEGLTTTAGNVRSSAAEYLSLDHGAADSFQPLLRAHDAPSGQHTTAR